MQILTINCGSSSLKFDVLDVTAEGARDVTKLASGAVDLDGPQHASTLDVGGTRLQRSVPVQSHADAFAVAADLLADAHLDTAIEAIGHRVVHGGVHLRHPVLIDQLVMEAITAASELAPLHNGPALEAMRAAAGRFSGTPMVATFDTAFYADLPERASRYALAQELSVRLGIRRFGFHGLAHRYMVETYRDLRPDVLKPRLITLQLGNGCSATASVDGAPIDTSMGFTPLEGLVMGTRSGDLDPAVALYLAEHEALTPREVESLLNTRSGLLGLSGLSSDMRVLTAAAAAGHVAAAEAIDAFCYRATKYIGAYFAALGGAEAVIFGGGIGEHNAEIRERICAGMAWAGLRLDVAANRATMTGATRISESAGSVEAWVLPVDEAAVIARDTADCLARAHPTTAETVDR